MGGYNLYLGHSGENDQQYADQSCIMGFSYSVDEGPFGAEMCFNPPKSQFLNWYAGTYLNLDVNYFNTNDSWSGPLIGVANFSTNPTENISPEGFQYYTSIKLPKDGLYPNRDNFVGYNHAVGSNKGSQEARNKVTVQNQNIDKLIGAKSN